MASRNSWLLLAGCCLIPLFSFPRALLSDRTLFARDINTVWSPQVEAVVRQIASGEMPFVDARRGFGQPLFADPRAEVLYPLSWIHWVIPPDKSYSIFCALHLIIAALGAARLARRLSPETNLAGPWTAGLAYGASGPLLSLVSHWHHLAAAAWMPWIVLKCDPEQGARTPWLSLAALVTLQILAGSPDYVLTTFLLCFWRGVTRSDLPAGTRLKLAVGLGLGVLLSSAQLLPSLSFAHDADRAKYPIGWALSPLHPALTIETVLPVRAETWPLRPQAAETLLGGMQVWMFSHYLGLSVWVLASMGLAGARSRDRRFALGAIFLGLTMSWGVRNGAIQEFLAGVPFLSGLRFPTKHLVAASLGLALLASRAIASPGRWTPSARRAVLLGVAVTVVAVVGLYVWATGQPGLPPMAVLSRILLPIGLALSVAFFSRHLSRLALLAPLAVGADLLGSQVELNPTTPSSLFRERPPMSAGLPPGARLYVSDYSITLPGRSLRPGDQTASGPSRPGIRPPRGAAYRLQQIPAGFTPSESLVLAATWYMNPPIAGRFGYHGSFDLDILDFYRAPLKKVVETFVTSRDSDFVMDQLRRGSVDYVITMDAPDLWNGLPLVAEERRFFADPVRIYEVPDRWPRVRYETSAGERDVEAGAPGILEMTDGRIVVQTSTTRPTGLVVAVSNDRGWEARIDGARSVIEDNGMAFIRVPLDAGSHRVEIRYTPPLLGAGLVLSLLSVGMVLALNFGEGRKLRERFRGGLPRWW